MRNQNQTKTLPAPSRLYLPKLGSPPATILEYLCARFPQIGMPLWEERIRRGLVTIDTGEAIGPETPYRHGITVHYHRETPFEPESPEPETIIYSDSEIVVADKPHGMPVTPAGEYVTRSLLHRLQADSGIADLAPLHRLDRDTAGVVLFSKNAATRARYHALFAKRTIEREYLAVGHIHKVPEQRRWVVENRIGGGHPWFRQSIVEGPANAATEIELLGVHEDRGVFRLRPQTGRQHQLRLHMSSLGFPILGDPLYPEVRPQGDGDYPMQLLAVRLSFVDPVTATLREFTSIRKLALAGSVSV